MAMTVAMAMPPEGGRFRLVARCPVPVARFEVTLFERFAVLLSIVCFGVGGRRGVALVYCTGLGSLCLVAV